MKSEKAKAIAIDKSFDMKIYIPLLVSIISMFQTACREKEKYADLDVAVSSKLIETEIPGVFVTGLHVIETTDTSKVVFHCARACADTKNYFQYVSHPYTICTPPDFVLDESMVSTLKEKQQDSIIPILREKSKITHKITEEIRFKGFNKLFCKTVNGPWGAEVSLSHFLTFFVAWSPREY